LSIIEIGKGLSKFTKNTIVSDTGSTKKAIVNELSPLIPKFVGAHPMAGSHKKGIKFASEELFKNCILVLTPTENTDKKSKEIIKRLWKKMGANVIEIDPEIHDSLVSLSSHIPHIASNILVELIGSKKEAFPLISSGFRDMTRLSLGDPYLWKDIFLTNKENIIKGLDEIGKIIVKWKCLMNNEEMLIEKLKEINKIAMEVNYGENR